MRLLFTYVFCVCLIGAASAQGSLRLTGTVTSSEGEKLPGISLVIKGSQTGTTTDNNGAYTLNYSSPATLVVSGIGFATKEFQLTGQTSLNINLEYDDEELGEVVVVGYGTQRRKEVTSAIASVKAEDFTKGTVRDAGQLIQGKVAGLRITTPSGDPNQSTQINLRGINSINGSSDPLVLVDGVPGSITTVAPEDIESIDVLKDGSAAAIYGTRATGGVVLITTRKGKRDRSVVEYNNYLNVQTIFRKPELMDASDYRRLIAEGNNYQDLGTETNWLNEILRKPISHNHNLTLTDAV